MKALVFSNQGRTPPEVDADGDWWLEVRQPRSVSGAELPRSLHDNKPRVVGPFEFGGSHAATCSHRGDPNVQVLLLPAESRSGEFAVDEIGPYAGDQRFDYTGIGYVGVEAYDEWTLELE